MQNVKRREVQGVCGETVGIVELKCNHKQSVERWRTHKEEWGEKEGYVQLDAGEFVGAKYLSEGTP